MNTKPEDKDQTSKDQTSKDQTSKDQTSKDQTSKDQTSKDQRHICYMCDGSGGEWFDACQTCQGQGKVSSPNDW